MSYENSYNPNQPRDKNGEWSKEVGALDISDEAKMGIMNNIKIENNRFIPAKTIEEAEQRLKDIGIQEVSLKGMKPDQFNSVLQGVTEENNSSKISLSKIVTYRSSGSSAKALYSPSNNSISINLSKLKEVEYSAIKSYPDQLKSIEDSKQFIRDNYQNKPGYSQGTVYSRINAFNNRAFYIKQKIENGETPRHWTVSSGFEDKGKSLKATIHHEVGHYRQERQLKGEYWSSQPKSSVSEYGRTNKGEYFSEWYSHYRMNGEKDVPEDILKLFKKLA